MLRRDSKTGALGIATLVAVGSAAVLPASAAADANIQVLTGSVGGVDQVGVVAVTYNTATRASLSFDTGASAGAQDDSIRVDALDAATDLTPGPGCRDESPTRVRCDGAFPSGTKVNVVRAANIGPALSGLGTTNDFFKLNDLLASAADPRIRTGSGNDVVDLSTAVGEAGLQPSPFGQRFEVDTGPGNDEVIEGNRGVKAVLGDGDDIVRPRRNQPPQALAPSGSISEFDGGGGLDVVNQSGRDRAFRIDLSAGTIKTSGIQVEDGLEARLSRMENVVGSSGNDTIRGTTGNNRLIGGAGADTIEGLAGDDRLAAFLTESPPPIPPAGQVETDRDTLDGGSGADVLNVSGDGLRDTVNCGADGTRTTSAFVNGQLVSFTFFVGDKVFADLADVPVNCEEIEQQAKEERGTVRLKPLGRGLPRSGRLRVRLTCPRRALTSCAGRVGFRVGGGPAVPGRGAVRYSIRKGGGKTVTVSLPAGTKIARRTRLRLIAVERGESSPRTRVLVLNSGR